jgi:hypothetical protein
VDCGEFLQTSHPPEAAHGPFPSSEWLVRVLSAVVQPTADFAFVDGTELLEGGTVGCQSIRDETLGLTVPREIS